MSVAHVIGVLRRGTILSGSVFVGEQRAHVVIGLPLDQVVVRQHRMHAILGVAATNTVGVNTQRAYAVFGTAATNTVGVNTQRAYAVFGTAASDSIGVTTHHAYAIIYP